MMRRTRPWWALLTTIVLVSASLLAPREGAAYKIVGSVDPVDRAGRGDPDNPTEQRPQLGKGQQLSLGVIVVAIQPLPGMQLTLRLPIRVAAMIGKIRAVVR